MRTRVTTLRATVAGIAAAACQRGRLSYVTACRSELASLHAAVQPVYDEVGRDALAREVMRAVYEMRRDGSATPPALPACRSRRYEAVAKGAGLVATGRYSVEGDVMTLIYDAPAPGGYIAGNLYRQRWSIFRKSLSFSRVARSDVDFVLLVNPLTRVD